LQGPLSLGDNMTGNFKKSTISWEAFEQWRNYFLSMDHMEFHDMMAAALSVYAMAGDESPVMEEGLIWEHEVKFSGNPMHN